MNGVPIVRHDGHVCWCKHPSHENEKLLDLLQDIEGIVRDPTYRVVGGESFSKGARILARIRSVLGHAAGEQTDALEARTHQEQTP